MRVKGRPIAKVPTQISGLDEVLEGGLPRGRTTLASGGPGSGKTVLGLEFLCSGALAGEPGVFVTLEVRTEAVREKSVRFSVSPPRGLGRHGLRGSPSPVLSGWPHASRCSG